ncbi:MAG: flagellar biosynthetic protein FliR [Gammaproteobacteria bacterium]|nr:flagellar biosynthetic protein FliR [Gammaproteobacteria bacterium]
MVLTTEQIGLFMGSIFWPFVRISAMMMAAPIFGARMVPVRIRLLMAMAFSMVAIPMLPPVPAVDPISFQAMFILLQQVLIGVAMGFIIQMVFQTLVIAGETIANGMGLGFARMVDPANGVQVPVVSQFLIVMATLLFVILNGHLMLIELVVQSFRWLPISEQGLSSKGIWEIASMGTQMFAGGLLVALPAVVAMLVVNISMGVITRAAPQMNIFAVGFPLMLLLGFVFLAATTPSILTRFAQLMMDSFEAIQSMLTAR